MAIVDFLRDLFAHLLTDSLGAVLSFLAGTYVGSRIHLAQDRRKRIMAAQRPIRDAVLLQLEHPPPMRAIATVQEADELSQALGWWKRRCLRRAMQAHAAAREQAMVHDAAGQPVFADTTELRHALRRIERLTRAR
jgi:hypothetical protein